MGSLCSNFFSRVYCKDSPYGDSRKSLWSNLFFAYIGGTGHVEAVGEVSGATFLVESIGWTGHVKAVGEVSGATFFVAYIRWTGHM
jgi:hypothetical protein